MFNNEGVFLGELTCCVETFCFHPASEFGTNLSIGKERWPSGRRHTLAKGAGKKFPREFESRPFHHLKKALNVEFDAFFNFKIFIF